MYNEVDCFFVCFFFDQGKKRCIRMEIPKVDAIFTGTGDLFASVLLAWLYRHPDDLALACEATVSTVQAVLRRTLAHAQSKSQVKRETSQGFHGQWRYIGTVWGLCHYSKPMQDRSGPDPGFFKGEGGWHLALQNQ